MEVGVSVNEGKTKYVVGRGIPLENEHHGLEYKKSHFKKAKQFKYLDTVTTDSKTV